jgi:hypothetical protein
MGCIIMNRTLEERVAWIMNRKTSNDCLEEKAKRLKSNDRLEEKRKKIERSGL